MCLIPAGGLADRSAKTLSLEVRLNERRSPIRFILALRIRRLPFKLSSEANHFFIECVSYIAKTSKVCGQDKAVSLLRFMYAARAKRVRTC